MGRFFLGRSSSTTCAARSTACSSVGEKLLNGDDLVDESKYVEVPILVASADEFSDVKSLRHERIVEIPKYKRTFPELP